MKGINTIVFIDTEISKTVGCIELISIQAINILVCQHILNPYIQLINKRNIPDL